MADYSAIAPPGARSGMTVDARIPEAVVKVVLPKNKATRQLIHRTVEFVVNHGPAFEAEVARQRAGDPTVSVPFCYGGHASVWGGVVAQRGLVSEERV